MTFPQGPNRYEQGSWDWLRHQYERLDRRLRALEGGSPMRAAGMRMDDTGMVVSSSLGVTGDLSASGDTEIGGNLSITGDTDITGDLSVQGTFTLPNNSIQDDWLANPVVVRAAATVTENEWTTSGSWQTRASSTIAIPSGFTKASVVCWASMHFQDSAPNSGYVRAGIDGQNGAQLGGLANLNIGCTALYTRNLTGLSGGSIALTAQVISGAPSSATTGRIAQVSGLAIFTR